ncbi:MAG: hypothetical protein KAX49_14430 [Halanaerobiales bacterium]|nr:hypothetical protein [Halanaerobiales bacterium]
MTEENKKTNEKENFDTSKFVVEKTLKAWGNSSAIILTKDLAKFLEVKINDTICIVPETGKHGKFLALYKKK